MYAAWQRVDCDAHSTARSSALPITTFDAERLQRITAPASAPCVEGGVADQKSSQISTWKTKSGRSEAANTRSVPNGTCCPAMSTSSSTTPAPGANQRFS